MAKSSPVSAKTRKAREMSMREVNARMCEVSGFEIRHGDVCVREYGAPPQWSVCDRCGVKLSMQFDLVRRATDAGYVQYGHTRYIWHEGEWYIPRDDKGVVQYVYKE